MNGNKILKLCAIIIAILFLSGCTGKKIEAENSVALIENEPYAISQDYDIKDTYAIVISGYIDPVKSSSDYGTRPYSIILTAVGGHFASRSTLGQEELTIGKEMLVKSDNKNKSIEIKQINFGFKDGKKVAMANVIIRENP